MRNNNHHCYVTLCNDDCIWVISSFSSSCFVMLATEALNETSRATRELGAKYSLQTTVHTSQSFWKGAVFDSSAAVQFLHLVAQHKCLHL